MRLARIISSGEVPNAGEMVDALATLNDVIENWGTEPLSVWGSANNIVATVGGQATYTVGPGGNFNFTRPQDISGAFVTYQGVDFSLNIVGQLEYNGISLKTQQEPIPRWLLYVKDFPLGLATLWPVPSLAIPLTISSNRQITQIPTTSTVLNFPPGAAKALRYVLAIELATEFDAPISETMISIAADARADYKRSNKVQRQTQFDNALLGNGYGLGNWRTFG